MKNPNPVKPNSCPEIKRLIDKRLDSDKTVPIELNNIIKEYDTLYRLEEELESLDGALLDWSKFGSFLFDKFGKDWYLEQIREAGL